MKKDNTFPNYLRDILKIAKKNSPSMRLFLVFDFLPGPSHAPSQVSMFEKGIFKDLLGPAAGAIIDILGILAEPNANSVIVHLHKILLQKHKFSYPNSNLQINLRGPFFEEFLRFLSIDLSEAFCSRSLGFGIRSA